MIISRLLEGGLMTDQINVFCIKTVHRDYGGGPIQDEFDNNEFYLDTHVMELKNQLDQRFKRNIRFFCLTNESSIASPDVNLMDVSKYDMWGWWNKMLLFKKPYTQPGLNIYIDLDTVIQRDITDIIYYAVHNKLTTIYCYFKPIDWERQAYPASGFNPFFKHVTLMNSSFMMWYDDELEFIWNQFEREMDKTMVVLRGNDEYLNLFHKDIIKFMPRGIFYSYFYGAEEGSEFFHKDKDPFVKRPEYFIRMLNGYGKKKHRVHARFAESGDPVPLDYKVKSTVARELRQIFDDEGIRTDENGKPIELTYNKVGLEVST